MQFTLQSTEMPIYLPSGNPPYRIRYYFECHEIESRDPWPHNDSGRPASGGGDPFLYVLGNKEMKAFVLSCTHFARDNVFLGNAMLGVIVILLGTASYGSCYGWASKCPHDSTNSIFENARKFREDGIGYIMIEHLHKGGGSTLCHLMKMGNNVRIHNDSNCLVKLENAKIWRSIPNRWSIDDLEGFLRNMSMNIISNEDAVFPIKLRPALYDHNSSSSPWSFITIVRNPVKRILSHYRFEGLASKYDSVWQWVQSAPFHTQNFMVRKFASLYPPHMPLRYLDTPSTHWSLLMDSWSEAQQAMNTPVKLPPVTRKDLERAKAVLAQFSVVLILEWMAETAPLLQHYFGIPVSDTRARDYFGNLYPSFDSPVSNMKGANFSTRILYANISSLNDYDIELYRYAKYLARCNTLRTYFKDDDYAEYISSDRIPFGSRQRLKHNVKFERPVRKRSRQSRSSVYPSHMTV